jgi:hypothetical protein
MRKTTVIYHRSDLAGIFCREIARKFLPDAELIGWDFTDEPLEFPKEGTVYFLDLPPEKPFGRELTFEEKERVIWIAHQELLSNENYLQYAKEQENAAIIKEIGFFFHWEGLWWLACNHARCNSHLFTAGLKPEYDACFGFKFTGRGDWSVSLYHAPGKEHHDLSLIAVKYGGGGHRGDCGFRTRSLPFLVPSSPSVETNQDERR